MILVILTWLRSDDSCDSDLAPQSPDRVSATWAPPSIPLPGVAAVAISAVEDAAAQGQPVGGLLPSETLAGGTLLSNSSVNQQLRV